MGLGSHGPWDTGVSAGRTPTPFHAGCLAIGLGGVPVDFGVGVVEMAAVDDIAEVFAGVGGVGAVECDELVLGGGWKVKDEESEEKGCLMEHGVYLVSRRC